MEEKDRVLILGATGYIGRRVVKASIALRHPTFILFRPENVSDNDKCQLFMEFKMEGAQLLQESLDDHESLVAALKQVDVVISTIAGNSMLIYDPNSTNRRLIYTSRRLILNLVEAITEVGTIKRYLPSEFGMDADRVEHATPPGGKLFKDKRVIRRAIEKAGIPYTYVSANCFAGKFLAGLAHFVAFMPPRDRIKTHSDGDRKCIWVNELDVGMYTMLAVDDPRTLNKVLYIRPPANILTQMEVVGIWERLIGKELSKTFISDKEWLSTMEKEEGLFERTAMARFYDIFYLGVLDFEVEETLDGVDSSKLYPGYKYVTAKEYLKRFI